MTIAAVTTESLDLIYQELVAELGDPFDSSDIDDAQGRYVEGRSGYRKFVQDMYLAQIDKANEPATVELPVLKKHKK